MGLGSVARRGVDGAGDNDDGVGFGVLALFSGVAGGGVDGDGGCDDAVRGTFCVVGWCSCFADVPFAVPLFFSPSDGTSAENSVNLDQ